MRIGSGVLLAKVICVVVAASTERSCPSPVQRLPAAWTVVVSRMQRVAEIQAWARRREKSQIMALASVVARVLKYCLGAAKASSDFDLVVDNCNLARLGMTSSARKGRTNEEIGRGPMPVQRLNSAYGPDAVGPPATRQPPITRRARECACAIRTEGKFQAVRAEQ